MEVHVIEGLFAATAQRSQQVNGTGRRCSPHLVCGWLRQLSPMAGRFSCRRSSLPPTKWFVTITAASQGGAITIQG